MPKVALAFMAHPDDAEILCAGTLFRLHQEHGYHIHIATCTPGDAGSPDLPPDEIADVRRKEGAAAAARLQGQYHCLEQRDLKVHFSPQTVQHAVDLLRRINPDIVFTHPRHDYMIDHEQCHLLARAATFGFPIPNMSELPVPENAHLPHLYYVDPLEARDPYTGQAAPHSTLIDITGVIDRKADMLACHASQRQWLRSHHGIDEYIDAMKRHTAERGRTRGTDHAEAFSQHQGHAYPHDDILTQLLK